MSVFILPKCIIYLPKHPKISAKISPTDTAPFVPYTAALTFPVQALCSSVFFIVMLVTLFAKTCSCEVDLSIAVMALLYFSLAFLI